MIKLNMEDKMEENINKKMLVFTIVITLIAIISVAVVSQAIASYKIEKLQESVNPILLELDNSISDLKVQNAQIVEQLEQLKNKDYTTTEFDYTELLEQLAKNENRLTEMMKEFNRIRGEIANIEIHPVVHVTTLY
jgi:predicted PurR-regulated permease PerM